MKSVLRDRGVAIAGSLSAGVAYRWHQPLRQGKVRLQQ